MAQTQPNYPFARDDLRAEVEAIRAYTLADPKLRDLCHHFCFDFRLGAFDRARFIVMGMNPGETAEDRDFADGPCEESSLVDYRGGIDSRARSRWFNTCREMLGTDQIALSELCFWSALNVAELVARLGPIEGSTYLQFCKRLNERLIAFHDPEALVLSGLQWAPLASKLYDLRHVRTLRAENGHRLVEHYERAGVPWLFTKHWSGARGFTKAQKASIKDYIQAHTRVGGRRKTPDRDHPPVQTGAAKLGGGSSGAELSFLTFLLAVIILPFVLILQVAKAGTQRGPRRPSAARTRVRRQPMRKPRPTKWIAGRPARRRRRKAWWRITPR